MLPAAMAIDVVILTGLLFFTGGPFNPFSFLYLVHIALGAVVLRPVWTWSLVALSLVCSGALFYGHVWLKLDYSDPASHAQHMRMHLEGMWIAFAVAAGFIVYFVTRVRRALARREADLAAERALAARNERLASLATLAAGAAHELATPAGHHRGGGPRDSSGSPSGRGPGRRSRTSGSSGRRSIAAGRSSASWPPTPGPAPGESFVRTTLSEVVAAGPRRAARRPAGADRALARAATGRCWSPRRALSQALRAVMKNAQDASSARRRGAGDRPGRGGPAACSR